MKHHVRYVLIAVASALILAVLVVFGIVVWVIHVGSSGLSANPVIAGRTIAHWLPIGTPDADVRKIMSQHGCSPVDTFPNGKGEDAIYYGRETMFHAWTIIIHERDGKTNTTNFPVIVYFTLIRIRT